MQGRHALQTSDALGAASVQLGPGVVALVVALHTEMGVPLAKVAHVLRTTFGLQVTPGGLAHLLHRVARDAAPTYTALCEQVRNAPVVTPDETGWRVGAISHWLWAFVTPETTVYAICPGRGFADATTVLGADFAGVPLTEVPDGCVNVHGHEHAFKPLRQERWINVSVEQTLYRPLDVRTQIIIPLAKALVARRIPPGLTTAERVRHARLVGV